MKRGVNLFLTLFATVTGVLHIWGAYGGPEFLFYLCKPLPILCFIVMVLLAGSLQGIRYRNLILAGLVLSVCGDILLMVPADLFLPGLVAFLIAHILYICAFRTGRGRSTNFLPLILLVPVAAGLFLYLNPSLGEMRIPVIVYMAVIVTMVWQAAGRWMPHRSTGTLLAAAGALLFMTSDTVLAVDRFRGHFEAAVICIMVTYYAAQWLIARSACSK